MIRKNLPYMPSQYVTMAGPIQCYQCFSIITPGRELKVMLPIYIIMSNSGTPMDPDVFLMKGKLARAVKPFRIIPTPGEPEPDVPPQEQPAVQPLPNMQQEQQAPGWQQIQWNQLEQPQPAMPQQLGLFQPEVQLVEMQQPVVQQQQVLMQGFQPALVMQCPQQPQWQDMQQLHAAQSYSSCTASAFFCHPLLQLMNKEAAI